MASDFQKLKERIYNTVHDPVFQKPIQTVDYSKKGQIILVTRIKPNPKY